MEALKVLAGNGIWSLLTVVFIFLVLCLLVKKGILSFKGHGLTLGAAESESKIRNMQQLFSKSLFESTIADLPKECEYYHKRFVISQCMDEVERMIRENHISDDATYVETEFQIIYAIVLKYTTMDYFRQDGFKTYLHNLIEKLVIQLVKIRKQYS